MFRLPSYSLLGGNRGGTVAIPRLSRSLCGGERVGGGGEGVAVERRSGAPE